MRPADVELERFDEHSGRIVVNGHRFRLVTGHARADPPGRGRRRHPPGQPRRGRRRPLARARAGRRDAAGGRRRGRGGRAGARAGEHEDGDGAARAVPRPGARVPGVGGQPGRDRRAAAAPGAARRRRRRRGRPRPPARPSSWTCPPSRRTCSAAERVDAWPAGPAQPAARLRRRPAATASACCPATWPRGPSSAAGRSPGEVDLLTVFADLSELSRNRPGGERGRAGQPGAQPARVLPHATCRASTSSGPALPKASRPSCQQVLGHYGVDDLDRTPELEDAVFRIFLAQQRTSADVAVVVGAAAAVAGRSRRRPRRCASAPGSRWSTWSPPPRCASRRCRDLARGVVFRWFAQPLLRRNRAEVYAAVRDRPAPPRRATRTRRTAPSGSQAMVASTEPLVRLLGQRIGRRRPGPRAAAGGADPPLLRQPRAVRRSPRGRSRAARSSPPSTPARAA